MCVFNKTAFCNFCGHDVYVFHSFTFAIGDYTLSTSPVNSSHRQLCGTFVHPRYVSMKHHRDVRYVIVNQRHSLEWRSNNHTNKVPWWCESDAHYPGGTQWDHLHFVPTPGVPYNQLAVQWSGHAMPAKTKPAWWTMVLLSYGSHHSHFHPI